MRVSSSLKLRNTSNFHILEEEEEDDDDDGRRAIKEMDELEQWGYRFIKLQVWLKTLKKKPLDQCIWK